MLEILDTTLREGEQTPYVNFTVDEKVEIARMLECIGVDIGEPPWCSSTIASRSFAGGVCFSR